MTRTLVIDNYDSFTYNLVHFLGELGADTTVVRNDKITLDEIAAMAPEAIVLSPGPCTPIEAGICLTLIDRFKADMPICSAASMPASRRPATTHSWFGRKPCPMCWRLRPQRTTG